MYGREIQNQPTNPQNTMKHQIRSTVVFLGQDYDRNTQWLGQANKWAGINRVERTRYTIRHDAEVTVEMIAEDCFCVFNAPDEALSENQLKRRGNYRGVSLSVGDIVQVFRNGVLVAEALCDPTGWQIRDTLVKIS
jgi:hypothetical protein